MRLRGYFIMFITSTTFWLFALKPRKQRYTLSLFADQDSLEMNVIPSRVFNVLNGKWWCYVIYYVWICWLTTNRIDIIWQLQCVWLTKYRSRYYIQQMGLATKWILSCNRYSEWILQIPVLWASSLLLLYPVAALEIKALFCCFIRTLFIGRGF